VDVSYGQLAWSLRNDPRVRVLERTNVRALDAATLGDPVDLVVADLSFIGLRAVRDALTRAARDGGQLVLLVKPQFELPRERVPRGGGGVVRDRAHWVEALRLVSAAYRDAGCALAGACASPLPGPKGNREFFLHLVVGGADAGDGPIDRAVRAAP
jgi:23S rRNA (cytidine1920-2'-O)/16S rRNA (cytidine1409-2'-O)-methyltransferase